MSETLALLGQVFVVSKDGAQVPMFIVAPLNVSLDGSNPTVLVGYGGHPPGPCHAGCARSGASLRLIAAKQGLRLPCMLQGQPCGCMLVPRQHPLYYPPVLSRQYSGCVCTLSSLKLRWAVCWDASVMHKCFKVLYAGVFDRLPEDRHAFICREPPGFLARLQRRICYCQHKARS